MFKRIKRLLRKRNNGGFTLVEVIVACALLAILMLGMFGFIQPVLNSIKVKEQNARAVMLCETIESYIANNIKYAYYVQTFSGVIPADVKSTGGADAPIAGEKYAGTEFPASKDDSLELMRTCLESELGTDNYEIRCIGMRWLNETATGKKKLMLTNEVVDQKTLALTPGKTMRVFEDCFYDGLYPVLEYKNYNNQYKIKADDGTLVDRYPADEVRIAPAVEITMNVYLDPTCYSTTETTRKDALISFEGTTYQDFRNIASIYTINSSGAYKVQPHIEVHSYAEALANSGGAKYTDPDVGVCYYPDTFIYYLVRKTKTGDESTPSPSPSPSPAPTT